MDIETKKEFEKISSEFKTMHLEFRKIDQRFDQVDNDISLVLMTVSKTYEELEIEVKSINAHMVTKDYLDRRLERFVSTNKLLLREEGPDYKV